MLPEAPGDVPPELQAAVIEAFPQFTRSRFSIEGRGWHSLAIDIDDRFIAKFPQGSEAEEALRREARLLAAVRPYLALSVPDMQLAERPILFSLHEKLAGDILLGEDYERLPDGARDTLAETLARFFADLHAIEPEHMRAAGAGPVEWWDVRGGTLATVWPKLPTSVAARAQAAIAEYATRQWREEVYGFFDAHGWNMAFDRKLQRLNGIFDFADSGFGPVAREFVPVALISPELARRSMRAYEKLAKREVDPSDVFLLAAAARLSEFAGALGAGAHVDDMRDLVIDWFSQSEIACHL